MDNWYYINNQKSTGPLSESEFVKLKAQGEIQARTLVWNPNLPYQWVKFENLPQELFSREQVSEFRYPVVPETLFNQKSAQDLCPCDECNRLFGLAELIARENYLLCKECNPHFNRQYLNQLKSMRSPRCAECGKVFLRVEMITFNHVFVCANCKPVFLQKLKEGVYKEEPMTVVAEMRYAGFWIRFAASIIDSIILYIANIPFTFLNPFLIERWKTSPSYFFIIQGNIMLFGFIISAAYEILMIGKYGATVGTIFGS